MDGYTQLAWYIALGTALGVIVLVIPQLLAPRSRGRQTESTYECGVDTVGSSWMRFSIAYYVFALIFVAFEVDILYLFPAALAYPESGWRGFTEVAIFLAILSLAILYAWRKGVFLWQAHRAPQSRSTVSGSAGAEPGR